MKSAGTLIYSIGIFEGANPEQQSFGNRENDQANQFMHAVSSNYPNATAYDKANWVTGGNLGYYKATNSADDLTKIFDDIQKEITTGSAYSGVSIVDELSEYAQVDGVVWNMASMRNFGGATYCRVTGGVTLNVTNLPSGATPPVLERDYTLWYSDAGNGKDPRRIRRRLRAAAQRDLHALVRHSANRQRLRAGQYGRRRHQLRRDRRRGHRHDFRRKAGASDRTRRRRSVTPSTSSPPARPTSIPYCRCRPPTWS